MDSWYQDDTDRTNYAKFLLTMQDATTVKKLIDIYDTVLWKFILKYNGLGKEELVSNTWYDINMLSNDTKVYWRSLNFFLNENIERLFKTQNYSDKLAFECITNLREATNCDEIRNYIFSKSSDFVLSDKDRIMSSLSVVKEAPDHISPYNIDTNGYLEYSSKYVDNVKYLISLGFVRSIKDITFESKTNIIYITNTTSKVLLIVGIVAVIAIVSYILFNIGNIIISIIIILALLGFVRKWR